MGEEQKDSEPAAVFVVGSEEAGMRLDRLARKLLAGRPLAWVYRQIRTGKLRVDGRKRAESYRLKEGEGVELPESPGKKVRPQLGPWRGAQPDVVAEAEGWLAIDKPAGLAVQSGEETNSLIGWLRTRFPDAAHPVAPVHRIDRWTTGLVLCSKRPSAARRLLEAFDHREVGKWYLVLLEGSLAVASRVDAPLKRAAGEPTRAEIAADGASAVTRLVPLAEAEGFTLVLAILETGRLHQIRAHASHTGHPLAGDERYGGNPHLRLGIKPGQFLLHAWRLAFPDPATGETQELEAPLPERFDRVLGRLEVDVTAALDLAREMATKESE